MIFACVNLVGLFVHNLMEEAGRKAFLDTRNCINARLEMEDENEKLVSDDGLDCDGDLLIADFDVCRNDFCCQCFLSTSPWR